MGIPTMRERNQEEVASGVMPMRPKTRPILPFVETRRASIGRVIVAPMPTAAPLMAAMTGFRQAWMARATRPPVSRTRASPGSSRSVMSSRVGVRDSSRPKTLSFAVRSIPAQKALPAPVTTTARTPSSSLTSWKVASSSSAICTVKEFISSGRSSVTRRIPSCTVRERVSWSVLMRWPPSG